MVKDLFKSLCIPASKVTKQLLSVLLQFAYLFLHQLFTHLSVFHLELHIYEGFISRQDNWWKTNFHVPFWGKTKIEEIADAWQAAATTLLNRIFQKWTPSDKQSTNILCDNLKFFAWTLGSSYSRIIYPDNSKPPIVKVSAMKSDHFSGVPSVTTCFVYRQLI